ncbi:MAG: FAD-dependent oxidoreductase, partial [Limnobacter sp.]|nr:FAD-dependent oxidoreductase [Limnobacter sp.]
MNNYRALLEPDQRLVSIQDWLNQSETYAQIYLDHELKHKAVDKPATHEPAFWIQVGLNLAEPLAAITCRSKKQGCQPIKLLIIDPNPPSKVQVQSILDELKNNGEHDWATYLEPWLPAWPMRSPGLHRAKPAGLNVEVFFWFGDILEGLRATRGCSSLVLSDAIRITQTFEIHAVARLCAPDARLHLAGIPASLLPTLGYAGIKQEARSTGSASGGRTFRLSKKSTDTRTVKQPANVAVIGAGIAGTTVARRLCQAGIRVTLFDSGNGPAQGASGNWAGSFHPHITRDHTILSRLSHLGCEYTASSLQELTYAGLLRKGADWDLPGHLQSISSDKLDQFRDSVQKLRPDPSWFKWCEQGDAFKGSPPGLWFPLGGWVKPVRWVQANLQACGDLLTEQYGHCLDTVPEGFDAVVVACAQNSLSLASAPGYRANQVKGQISRYRKKMKLPCVLSGLSYAIDANEDWLLLGATYERPVLNLDPTIQADQENLQKFQLAHPHQPVGEWLDSRCAVRSVWPDRLPAVGKVYGQS